MPTEMSCSNPVTDGMGGHVYRWVRKASKRVEVSRVWHLHGQPQVPFRACPCQ